MYVRGFLGKGETILGHYGQWVWAYFSEAYWERALGFTGVRGVAHKGKYSCGRHSSTLFLKLDQQELREQLDTAGYTGAAGYTGTAGYTARLQDTQLEYRIHGWTTGYTAKQHTWLDYRIHSQTAGYVAGLQDTQPNSRICGWTTGYTAKQQDTWLDYRIHSQTGYVDTPRQQHLTAAGTRDRPIGAEPKPRSYFGSLLAATTGTDKNSCYPRSRNRPKRLVRDQ